MRERDQFNGGSERFHSPYTSPASSVATAMSGASSIGTLHPAPWCTPPRLFVDHEVKFYACSSWEMIIAYLNSMPEFEKSYLDVI
jgi:hypothetical protein